MRATRSLLPSIAAGFLALSLVGAPGLALGPGLVSVIHYVQGTHGFEPANDYTICEQHLGVAATPGVGGACQIPVASPTRSTIWVSDILQGPVGFSYWGIDAWHTGSCGVNGYAVGKIELTYEASDGCAYLWVNPDIASRAGTITVE